MAMLDVPSPIGYGEDVQLICGFELEEGEQLYASKWYKDNSEFYRYIPSDWPPGQFLALPGVRVDVTRSDEKSVFLQRVDLNSEGQYRCEVSGDAPYFQTIAAFKDMTIYVLPGEGPKITESQPKYQVGDTVYVNCTSAKSKPAAMLKWFINDEPVGDEYETRHSSTMHSDGLETSSLSLRFFATERHFHDGNMRLKCTATISQIYTMSNEELVLGGRQQTSGLHVTQNAVEELYSSAPQASPDWTFFILCSLLIILVKTAS